MINLEPVLDKIKKLVKTKPLEFWIEIKQGLKVERRDRKEFLAQRYLDKALSVRYLNKNKKAGLSYTTSLDPEELEEISTKAEIMSEYGVNSLFPEGDLNYPTIPKKPFIDINLEEMKKILIDLEEKALNYNKYISKIEKINLSCGSIKYILIRNDSELIWDEPFCSFIVSVIAKGKEKEVSSYEWYEGRELNYSELSKRIEFACQRASALSMSKKGKNLKMSVLFPPFVAVELLEALEFSFLGDEVLKGRSFLKDKIEKKVFSEKIILYDDGINPDLPEGRPFDDEGYPQNKKILIEKGIVKDFLFDNYWEREAKRRGLEKARAGNCRRPSFSFFPKISATNFYLSKGEKRRDELLKSEKEVFEVLEILGAHTINFISGDFSLGVSGVYYKNREPAESFCEMALTGNLFELFNRIVEIGSDLTFYGNIGSPSLLVEKIDLGG